MSDVVESGPRGRAGWVVGGVAVVALVAGLLRAGAGDETPSAAPSATATTPVPAVTASEPEPGVTVAPGPSLIAARRWDGPRDALLVARDAQVLRLPADDAAPYAIKGLGSPVTQMVPLDGGTLVVDSAGDHDSPAVMAFLPTASREPVPLGSAVYAFAAVEARSAWLVQDVPTASGPEFRLRRVDVLSGRVRERVTVPRDTQPVFAVATGLVLRSTAGTSGKGDTVWNPRTRAVVRTFRGTVQNVTPRFAVVGVAGCSAQCTEVVDVVDGSMVRTTGADGATHAPVLSPDGQWLVAFRARPDGIQQMVTTYLLSDDPTFVSDTEVSAETQVLLAWTRDSRRMYAALTTREGDGQVVRWEAGTQEVHLMNDGPVHALVAE